MGRLPLRVLHAGALRAAVSEALSPAFSRQAGIEVESVGGHSGALAESVRTGQLQGDVFLSASAAVTRRLMSGDPPALRWFWVFASNAVVLAYSPQSRRFGSFERARIGELPWYEVLAEPDIRLARNDPDWDPLGTYTVLAMELAERHYRMPGLRERLLGEPRNSRPVSRSTAIATMIGSAGT